MNPVNPAFEHTSHQGLNLVGEPIEVFDNLRDVLLGRLVFINCESLQICGTAPLGEGKSYKLDIHLPTSVCECPSVHLGAECVWRRPADDGNGEILSGFAISDMSPQAREQIQWLLDNNDPSVG